MSTTAPSRRTDPQTSREAGKRHAETAASHRQIILEAIRENPGHTSAEIAHGSRIERHEVSRRLTEIERAGDIARGEARECTTNGNRMATWWPVKRRPAELDHGPKSQKKFF